MKSTWETLLDSDRRVEALIDETIAKIKIEGATIRRISCCGRPSILIERRGQSFTLKVQDGVEAHYLIEILRQGYRKMAVERADQDFSYRE